MTIAISSVLLGNLGEPEDGCMDQCHLRSLRPPSEDKASHEPLDGAHPTT